MLLSCIFLTQVADINNFNETSKVVMTEGDTLDIYLQLKDMSVNPVSAGFNPPGRRFVPAAGATLQITIDALDSARRVVKQASQPFAQDPSIWKFSILPTDKVSGAHTLKILLNESGKTTNGVVSNGLYVQPLSAVI